MCKAMQNAHVFTAATAVDVFSCANILLILGVTAVASIFVAILNLALITLILLAVWHFFVKKTPGTSFW